MGVDVIFAGTPAASSTVSGTLKTATTATTNTGTAIDEAITPDAMAGSVHGTVKFGLTPVDSDTAVTVADGTQGIPIPASMNGMNLVSALAAVDDKGITGTTDIQVRRRRAGSEVDMLSTKITIGDEFYASDGVINTSNDDLATGDVIYIDRDAIHSGTAPNGLSVVLEARLP
jgi:hypothetical protein